MWNEKVLNCTKKLQFHLTNEAKNFSFKAKLLIGVAFRCRHVESCNQPALEGGEIKGGKISSKIFKLNPH
jgi:hypothetical protein